MAVDFEEILAGGHGAKWDRFAYISDAPNFGNPFGLHAYQFHRAAEVLVSAWHASPSHVLELPIAFVCRHYIELSLKSAWEDCGRAGYEYNDIPLTHDLSKLWKPVRSFCIEHAIFSSDDELVGKFEEVLVFLNELDQKSTAFRYPMDGQETHVVIDVPKLWQAMDLCSTFFLGLDAMTSQY